MSNRTDPKGYYARLGVASSASTEEIKKAYRARAMDFHPDRNPAKDATRVFQGIQEAYDILSDAKTRAKYDSIGIVAEHDTQTAGREPMEPIVCSKCGCISAQLRYAIFYEVKSYIFVMHRSARQGIFCAECATKEALKASALTWLLGWWSVWGLLYTVPALVTNLFGGERPKEHNARIMGYQATCFAAQGKIDLARAVAMEALALAMKIQSSPKNLLRRRLGYETNEATSKLVAQILVLLHEIGDGLPFKQLKPQWGFLSRIVVLQGVMALMFCGAIVWAIMAQ